MEPKISVIMPSLNVASYIRECMDSVLSQSLTDIEIICVDAGSDDGTLEILKEYEKSDGRIKLLISDVRSYGHQVNMALDVASGEYIGLVDTDDFIRPQMYATLYEKAKKEDADYVRADFEVFVHAPNGERIYMPYPVTWACAARYDRCFSSDDFASSMQTPDVFLWNGIYKKSFLNDNAIRFNESKGAANQDISVRYKIALCVTKGFYIHENVYCYRRDNAGASAYSAKVLSYHLDEYKEILRFAKRRGNLTGSQWSFLMREMSIIAFRTYQDMLIWGDPSEETEVILEDIRTLLRELENMDTLSAEYMNPNAILEARLFMDDAALCDGFARTRAKAVKAGLHHFLNKMQSKKKIWIFGTKKIADYAYLFLKSNGLDNIAGFFDNNKAVQGKEKCGLPIVDPEEMINTEKDAYFLIASSGYVDELKKWLLDRGVASDHFSAYGENFEQLLHPFICTNILMRKDN